MAEGRGAVSNGQKGSVGWVQQAVERRWGRWGALVHRGLHGGVMVGCTGACSGVRQECRKDTQELVRAQPRRRVRCVTTLPRRRCWAPQVFSESYFTFWVILAMLWGIVAAAVCIVLPVIEASDVIVAIWHGKKYSAAAVGGYSGYGGYYGCVEDSAHGEKAASQGQQAGHVADAGKYSLGGPQQQLQQQQQQQLQQQEPQRQRGPQQQRVHLELTQALNPAAGPRG